MNYSKIISYDTANCHGYSVTLWVCGCTHNCKNCFNPELHDFQYGKSFTPETVQVLLRELEKPHIKNFVILGGEPLNKENRLNVITLCNTIKEHNPEITIIIYTGYNKDELQLSSFEKKNIDYLIDGKFEEDNKVYSQLRGSSNQRCWNFIDNQEIDITDIYFKKS